jgi:hypothetical protein
MAHSQGLISDLEFIQMTSDPLNLPVTGRRFKKFQSMADDIEQLRDGLGQLLVPPDDPLESHPDGVMMALGDLVHRYCSVSPEDDRAPSLFDYFINAFPGIVASCPLACVPRGTAPGSSPLMFALARANGQNDRLPPAQRAAAKLRLSVLLVCLRAGIRDAPMMDGVAAVLDSMAGAADCRDDEVDLELAEQSGAAQWKEVEMLRFVDAEEEDAADWPMG